MGRLPSFKGVSSMNKWLHVRRLLLYLFSFLLLLEWLQPILFLTQSKYLIFFSIYLFLSLSLFYFKQPMLLNVLLAFLLSQFLLVVMFKEEGEGIYLFFKNEWLENLGFFVRFEWSMFSNGFQTLLFFMLLWIFSYFIHYWIDIRKSLTLFIVSTTLFFVAMELLNVYSVERHIIPLTWILLSLITIIRTTRLYRIPRQEGRLLLVRLVTIAILAFGVNQWSTFAEDGGQQQSQTISKTGYSLEDDRLGGDFIPEEEVVLHATTKEPRYYKIEVKDSYISKGWSISPDETEQQVAKDKGNHEKVAIQLVSDLPYLPYVYGMESIQEGKALIYQNERREQMYSSNQSIKKYTLNVVDFTFNEENLRQVKQQSYYRDRLELEKYLTLPAHLPPRIQQLAEEVTGQEESVYGKVKAIEQYLSSGPFIYSHELVGIPLEDQDYVDQFLFETQRGYCDNFSTAMAVMLRTLGIPTKWAKGFASGAEIQAENGQMVYEVKQSDAHSWVEVYFPGEGWVPFEPTPGFTSPVTDVEQVAPVPPEEPEEKPEQPKEERLPEPVQPKNNSHLLWPFLLSSGVGVTLLFLFYQYRQRNTLKGMHSHLLRLLKKRGWERQLGETERQFAKRVNQEANFPTFQQWVEARYQSKYRNTENSNNQQFKSFYRKILLEMKVDKRHRDE